MLEELRDTHDHSLAQPTPPTPERPVLEGEPGWLDETGRTTDSSSSESMPRSSTASSRPRDSHQTDTSL